MKNCSRCADWERIRTLEDALACISSAEDLRQVMRAQAWHQGDFDAIFDAAEDQGEPLAELRTTLKARWDELYEEVTQA